MENSSVQLMNLPNELLLMILKHLNSTEVRHSLMGVHVRFDEIISDPIFTHCLTLMRLSLDNVIYPLARRKLDRFCSQILPRIGEQVRWINVDAFSMERVLLAGKYSNLFGLGIYNVTQEAFQHVLLGEEFYFRFFQSFPDQFSSLYD